MRLFVARIDDEILGQAMIHTLVEDSTSAWVSFDALPEFRDLGIGTMLANVVEDLVRIEGRGTVIGYLGVPPAGGKQLEAPTGFGSIPASDPGVRFLSGRVTRSNRSNG